ncbi:hypothetical protein ABN214_15900 [Proteus terrae]|uniref:hypothetical protein n=1 Tax=Proteus terrae TaxID=1574161 RepID=UPI0032DB2CFE
MKNIIVKLPSSKDEAQISAMSLLNDAVTFLSKRDIYIYTDMNEVHNEKHAEPNTRTYHARVIADFIRPIDVALWKDATTVQVIAGVTGGNPTCVTIGETTYRAICMTSGVIWIDKYPNGLFNGKGANTLSIDTAIRRSREVSLLLANIIKSITN